METILIVDDQKNFRLALETLFASEGYEVLTASSGAEALTLVEETALDLIITDVRMPTLDGHQLLALLKANDPQIPVILLTAYGTVENAVEAMKLGAYDYLMKPFSNDNLLRVARKALEMYSLIKQNRSLREELRRSYAFEQIIGNSAPMREVFKAVRQVAPSRASVLIMGESGTGKELVAWAIHQQSPQADGPFVVINCGAIPRELMEAELLGYAKGAFTGAAKEGKKGKVELAHRGTLFLDEVGELPPATQMVLLRILDGQPFYPVGSNREVIVDVRVIAATNCDLGAAVAEGIFREDLYYRLNVFPISLPPLRERVEDIPPLAMHFAQKYSAEMGKEIEALTPEALSCLTAYSWPGNVRELKNIIERAIVLVNAPVLGTETLPAELAAGKALPTSLEPYAFSHLTLSKAISALEETMIRRTLKECDNVKARAAERLGLSRSNLQYKIHKYNITMDDE